MDEIKKSDVYYEDVISVLNQDCSWTSLKNCTILISGATGLIGTILVDMLVLLNNKFSLNLSLLLLTRNNRKSDYDFIHYIVHDISQPIEINTKVDYIIHAASNTHPMQYANSPIETITTNVFGTYNLLNVAKNNKNCRFLLVSSVEIYGDDTESRQNGFNENDMGYLNCNTSRACYNESKRLSETLCASFCSEMGIDYVVARLCRCYGPTLRRNDSKALSQFLYNAISGKNIVLKSEGNQYYSYLYSADAASALLFLLLNGKCGEAFNISEESSNITLKDLASLIAKIAGVNIVFDLPSDIEKKGFSKAQFAVLNPGKIYDLGWRPMFNITSGIKRTIEILKSFS